MTTDGDLLQTIETNKNKGIRQFWDLLLKKLFKTHFVGVTVDNLSGSLNTVGGLGVPVKKTNYQHATILNVI